MLLSGKCPGFYHAAAGTHQLQQSIVVQLCLMAVGTGLASAQPCSRWVAFL